MYDTANIADANFCSHQVLHTCLESVPYRTICTCAVSTSDSVDPDNAKEYICLSVCLYVCLSSLVWFGLVWFGLAWSGLSVCRSVGLVGRSFGLSIW